MESRVKPGGGSPPEHKGQYNKSRPAGFRQSAKHRLPCEIGILRQSGDMSIDIPKEMRAARVAEKGVLVYFNPNPSLLIGLTNRSLQLTLLHLNDPDTDAERPPMPSEDRSRRSMSYRYDGHGWRFPRRFRDQIPCYGKS